MLHHHRPPAAKSATIMALVLCCLGLGLLFLSPTSLAVKVDQFRSPATDARWQNPAQLQPAAATPVDAQAATTVHSSLLQQADRHQLVETQTQGFGANLANFAKSAAKGAASAVLNSVAGGTGGTGSPIASILPRPTPAAPSPLGAEDIENCVACRYIWLQVEMDVFNSQSEEQIYEAFTRRCTRAMLTSIFYSSCQHMQFYARKMVSEYMRGYTVNQICANSLLCL